MQKISGLVLVVFLPLVVSALVYGEGMSIPAMLTNFKSSQHNCAWTSIASGGFIAASWAGVNCYGSTCNQFSGTQFLSFANTKDWICSSFDSINSRCTLWNRANDCNLATPQKFQCISWTGNACTYWLGTCSSGMATASKWTCTNFQNDFCQEWTATLSAGMGVPMASQCTNWQNDKCFEWTNSLGETFGHVDSWISTGCEDLCKNVLCNSYCEGNIAYHSNGCVLGECKYTPEGCAYGCYEGLCQPSPSPSPEPSPSLEPSSSPSSEPSPSPTSSLEPSIEPTSTPSTEPSPEVTPSPSVEPTPTPSPEASPTPSFEASPSPSPSPTATAEPAGSQGGSSGWGGYWRPSETIEPTASPTHSQTPSPSLEPSVEPTVDLLLPSNQEIGTGTVSVLVDGRPGSGSVDFDSPSGKNSARALDAAGAVDFYFDEDGYWRITYGDTSKVLIVRKALVPTPSPAKLAAASKVGTQTGFATGTSFNAWWLVAGALFLLAVWLAYDRFWRVLSVKKSRHEGRVTITVTNRLGELKDVVLLDSVPEGNTAEAFSEAPEERDVINGKSLKWRRHTLAKGAKWTVSYASGVLGAQTRAEARGLDAKGREIHAWG